MRTAKTPLQSTICLNGQDIDVRFRRHRQARRYILRVNEEGSVQVTIPPFGSRREAYAFILEQNHWLEKQLIAAEGHRAAGQWEHGSLILFRGNAVRLDLEEDLFGMWVRFGDEEIHCSHRPHELKKIVTGHLRMMAQAEIPERVCELAAGHGVSFGRVRVRAQRTLWGSCSSGGTLSFNWKLIQMPPWVSDYVIHHELAHLRELNHSDRFWALVKSACPRYNHAERWLRLHGERLR